MSDATSKKIDNLFNRLHNEKSPMNSPICEPTNVSSRPSLLPLRPRPRDLPFVSKQNDNAETERKLKEIMKISGNLTIEGVLYKTDIRDMDHLEELGNGTCGHVVKMKHKPSRSIIAVKQMRRSGNSDENKRIIMDIEVVLKSHDCKYIVHCLGCFITESEVWICMELMDTCFDKLLKRFKQPVPEEVLGKVTLATVEALSYLKDEHGVIHRDVKPSNILLDMKGNVKLCDFGISGRLVDSMAKTRSAGCAAYMAPERIEPDPQNPDYDVRADVWSLGITLVELATGVFPYQDCKTDFEVLTKVIGQDPPSLPKDKDFSPEFRDFVSCCLRKDKKHRPKYTKLKHHPFIKKYEKISNVNVGEWYVHLIENAEDIMNRTASRQISTPTSIHKFSQHLRQNFMNGGGGGSSNTGESKRAQEYVERPVQRGAHMSRLASFQRELQAAPQGLRSGAQGEGGGGGAFAKVYSPYQAYQNHLACLKGQPEGDKEKDKGEPIMVNQPYYNQHRRVASETRWRSPNLSPVPLRHHFESDDYCNCGSANPMILQRFYHQQKQQQMAKEAEESGKKKFSSYIKMQLTGDRSGRSSRHQSPEPPPRLNRHPSSENQSPLAFRRNFLETHSPNSTSLSRRYISPTPPVPPPRRLSESTSVPGSPQHLRTRFHYTPEPQRRLFYNNDIS